MIFKIKSKKRGGHIHVRVFSSPKLDRTFSLNGTIVFLEEEWRVFGAILYKGATMTSHGLIFLGDEKPTYIRSKDV